MIKILSIILLLSVNSVKESYQILSQLFPDKIALAETSMTKAREVSGFLRTRASFDEIKQFLVTKYNIPYKILEEVNDKVNLLKILIIYFDHCIDDGKVREFEKDIYSLFESIPNYMDILKGFLIKRYNISESEFNIDEKAYYQKTRFGSNGLVFQASYSPFINERKKLIFDIWVREQLRFLDKSIESKIYDPKFANAFKLEELAALDKEISEVRIARVEKQFERMMLDIIVKYNASATDPAVSITDQRGVLIQLNDARNQILRNKEIQQTRAAAE